MSLGSELFVVSLVLLIPLLYSDHLPSVHWKDIIVGPVPSAPEVIVPPASRPQGPINMVSSSAARRRFIWDPKTGIPSTQTTVNELSPELPPVIGFGDRAGNTNMLGNLIPNVVALPPTTSTVETPKQPATPTPVGGDVQMAKLLRKVIPLYPPLAKSARISGVVRLIGTIGKDGTIQNLEVVSGHPILVQAALEAVRQWVYKPTLLNGNPVEVIAPIQVSFTLGQ